MGSKGSQFCRWHCKELWKTLSFVSKFTLSKWDGTNLVWINQIWFSYRSCLCGHKFCWRGLGRVPSTQRKSCNNDDVIKWKHVPRYWPVLRGIHRSPVNSPHKGQRRGALMLSLIGAWTNGWVNNRDAGDSRCRCAHYGVAVMMSLILNAISLPETN